MRTHHLVLSLALLLTAGSAATQNLEKGKEINGTCAACHGEYGSGGKKGEYPRIAGQRVMHIEEQLRNFRARKRINIPMYPYTQERELPDEDIKDIAAYLSSIVLPTTPPDFKDTDDALTRLLAMEKVMIIPKLDGDIPNGRTIYQEQCVDCHGKTGMGKGRYPMLFGQYTVYLRRQMDLFIKGDRPHDQEEGETKGSLNKLTAKDLDDVLAYITRLQEQDSAKQ